MVGSEDGLPIIPQPLQAQQSKGRLICKDPPLIQSDPQTAGVAQYLHAELARLGLKPKQCGSVQAAGGANSPASSIKVSIEQTMPQLQQHRGANEGYVLTVADDTGVSVQALTTRGAFYGVQSLLQLLKATADGYELPLVQVRSKGQQL
jgi:hexosaminidase